jgi:hypothetical protein
MKQYEEARGAFLAGAICQALALGALLFLATFELFCLAEDSQLFRYQGF